MLLWNGSSAAYTSADTASCSLGHPQRILIYASGVLASHSLSQRRLRRLMRLDKTRWDFSASVVKKENGR